MKILMVTNTFTPHIGGVAKSVSESSRRFEELGHDVMIVCPTFEGTESTRRVLRVPAIEHFRQTDFSFPLPIPSGVHRAVDEFEPDVIHSHHPFLLGDTALRIGSQHDIPVVFTHHTQYDKYAHYLGGENSTLAKRFINELDIGYCNLCDAVIAPSKTVADDLRACGVAPHVEVIPTGVDTNWWKAGSNEFWRREHGLPTGAFVIGHVGRLAKEKNLGFLTESVATYLQCDPNAWFAVSGAGPSASEIRESCEKIGVADRLILVGILDPVELRNFYHGFNVFVFASQSETQGIVLAEAMASGVPVVALDGPGVREIVVDQINGRLLMNQDCQEFANAIGWVAGMTPPNRSVMRGELQATANDYSLDRTAESLMQLYDWSIKSNRMQHPQQHKEWIAMVDRIEEELQIWSNYANALSKSVVASIGGKVLI